VPEKRTRKPKRKAAKTSRRPVVLTLSTAIEFA
jgi:hypothetical protein